MLPRDRVKNRVFNTQCQFGKEEQYYVDRWSSHQLWEFMPLAILVTEAR